MKTNPFHDVPSQPLPRGRFLYSEADEECFQLYGRDDDPRLWITQSGLANSSRAAGPFEPHEALRAIRLANLSIPDGCELGPWQDGLGFFKVGELPGDLHEWTPVKAARLEPSVTEYGPEDISRETVRACCAPPTYPPKVTRRAVDTAEPGLLDLVLSPIYRRHPEMRGVRVCALSKKWNGHPKGSLIWTPKASIERGFYVADFELPEGTDSGRPRPDGDEHGTTT